MKTNTCCFIGHRKIFNEEHLYSPLYETVEKLIVDKKVDTFLFGSKSEFDSLCLKVVTELKEKYPHIKRIYVRAEYQYINESYKKYLLENYEETYYPEKVIGSGKLAFVIRNCEMIDNGQFCIFYYNKDLEPISRKSGTKTAFEYAQKQGKSVINFGDSLCRLFLGQNGQYYLQKFYNFILEED